MRIQLSLTVLAISLAFAGCGSDHTHASGDQSETEAFRPRLEEGVQVVDVTVDLDGYDPARIALAEGVPARLVFTRTEENVCAEQVAIPVAGVSPVDLPLGTPVAIEFDPPESGSYAFVCGMNMMRGQLIVES